MSPPSPPTGDERPPTQQQDNDEVDSPPSYAYRRRNPRPVSVDEVNRNTQGLVSTVFQQLLVRDGHRVPDQLHQQVLPSLVNIPAGFWVPRSPWRGAGVKTGSLARILTSDYIHYIRCNSW